MTVSFQSVLCRSHLFNGVNQNRIIHFYRCNDKETAAIGGDCHLGTAGLNLFNIRVSTTAMKPATAAMAKAGW